MDIPLSDMKFTSRTKEKPGLPKKCSLTPLKIPKQNPIRKITKKMLMHLVKLKCAKTRPEMLNKVFI